MNSISLLTAFSVAMLMLLNATHAADSGSCDKQTLYTENAAELEKFLKECQVSAEDLDSPDSTQPLIWAATQNNNATAAILINAGADINVQKSTTSGDTPLIIALSNHNLGLVELLVAEGANPNLPNNFGATPFWGAAAMGNAEAVRLFLENGAEVDGPGRFPDPLAERKEIVTEITPLMMAVTAGNVEIVRLLLGHGASPTKQDSLGRDAAYYAGKSNNAQVEELLSDT